MTVAAFISSQRTEYRVPHAVTCRALGVSESWFYKWHRRRPTSRQQRLVELDEAIGQVFAASGGTYGSPRVTLDLRAAGWRVGENTVARRMATPGLVGRTPRGDVTSPGRAGDPSPRTGSGGSSPRSPRTCCGVAT